MEYCFLVQNPGSGTATNMVGTDTTPANLTYTVGSMLSGTSGAGATAAEDDNTAGADDTDPYGASVAGSVLTATAGIARARSGLRAQVPHHGELAAAQRAHAEIAFEQIKQQPRRRAARALKAAIPLHQQPRILISNRQ